jgi:hypothetical protein
VWRAFVSLPLFLAGLCFPAQAAAEAPAPPSQLQVLWAGGGVVQKQVVLAWVQSGPPTALYRVNVTSSSGDSGRQPLCAGGLPVAPNDTSGPHCLLLAAAAMDPASTNTPGLALGPELAPPPAPFNAEAVVFGLSDNATYTFVVGAANGDGMSPPSAAAAISFGTQAAPPPSGTQPTSRPAVVLVDGLDADGSFANFAELRSHLGGADVYPWPYATHQPLTLSAQQLSGYVGSLRQRYQRVAVAGYSLGGLVAAQSLAAPGNGRPDIVVTFDAPLQGVNMAAKRGVAAEAALQGAAGSPLLTALASALGISGTSALNAAAAYLSSALVPAGPIADDLNRLYQDPSQRNLPAVTAAIGQGSRLYTVANQADCLYYAVLCAGGPGVSDSDDRRTMHLGPPGAGDSQMDVDLGVRHGWWNIGAAHLDVMHSAQVQSTAAGYLTS